MIFRFDISTRGCYKLCVTMVVSVEVKVQLPKLKLVELPTFVK